MTISDIFIIAAVLIGPIAAVQVDKILQAMRESRETKVRIFKILMSTRASTLSPEHVQALNAIDLEFRGDKFTEVTTAWKIYLDHLYDFPTAETKDQTAKEDETSKKLLEERQRTWSDEATEHLSSLLLAMGKSLGYKEYDPVHMKKQIYSPRAYRQMEDELLLIRRGLIHLLFGNGRLKMDVTSFPSDEEAVETLKNLHNGLTELVYGKRTLPVEVKKPVEDKKSE